MKYYHVEFYQFAKQSEEVTVTKSCSGILTSEIDELSMEDIKSLINFCSFPSFNVFEPTSNSLGEQEKERLQSKIGENVEEFELKLAIRIDEKGIRTVVLDHNGDRKISVIFDIQHAGTSGPIITL